MNTIFGHGHSNHSKKLMQKIIVANWKMHKTIAEAKEFVKAIIPVVRECSVKAMIAAPYTCLSEISRQVQESSLILGAQNIDFHSEGAFTGEISALMVKDAGAQFVIVGHSERRRLYQETSEIVNLKAKAALKEYLQPLLCVGETYEERQANQTEAVLLEQLAISLNGCSKEEISKMVLAYEPIWAIGTKVAATPADAREAHKVCRRFIEDRWGNEVASRLPILYGGSVGVENASKLLAVDEINGLLVGSVSLKEESFTKILTSS